MAALLVVLLAFAWFEDGLLRRFVDPSLRRRALLGGDGFALAGVVLALCALELVWPIPLSMARPALHAFALVLTAFALAPDDAAARVASQSRLLREAAPLVVAPALAFVVESLVDSEYAGSQRMLLLPAWTGVLVFVRSIAGALDARIAVASRGAWPLRSARLASATLLSLALLGARAWLQ